MANIYNEPVYTDATTVKDSTDIAALAALDDADVDVLITQAQYAIDNYIVSFMLRCVEDQTFIFPTGTDDVCDAIPRDIVIATIKTVEYLFLKGQKSVIQMEGREVASESNLSRSISFTAGGDFDSLEWDLPVDVLPYLDKYKSDFYINIM